MNDLLWVHVVETVKHLFHEESCLLLSSNAKLLACVKQEAIAHVLHDNEDQVLDDLTAWLLDYSLISVVDKIDESWMAQTL